MAQTTAEKIERLEQEWDDLQTLIEGIIGSAKDGTFTKPGSLPDASTGPLNVDHDGFYKRWTNRQAEIEQRINELNESDVLLRESRGI